MGVHEDLVAARNLLNRSIWVRGQARIEMPEGFPIGFCLLGALVEVTEWPAQSRRASEACDVLSSRVRQRQPDLSSPAIVGPVSCWNDRYARSKQDVLDLLDEAIALTAPEPEDVELGTGVSVPRTTQREIPIHA